VPEVYHVHRPGAAARRRRRATEHLGRERPRVRALRERVAVTAVRAGHVVVRPERGADPHREGLLAGRQVRRPVDLAFQEQPVDLLLEAPDEPHAAVALEVVGGRLARLVPPLVRALGLRAGHRPPLHSNRLQRSGRFANIRPA
jgi:hypothetical protein